MLEVRPFSVRDKRFVELVNRSREPDRLATAEAAEAMRAVREEGVDGLLRLARRRDGDRGDGRDGLEALRIGEEAMAEARNRMPESFLAALSLARVNLRKFHEYQRRRGYVHDDGDNVTLSRRVIPLSRVGVLCGQSFSSLLMCAVPAQVAGVGTIVAAIAPDADGKIDDALLATAKVLGIDEAYSLPGALAAAAMAHGAGSLTRVDKIVGPGGPAAEAVKRRLRGRVGTDGPEGASELVVIADGGANAKFIAADLAAQAETGGDGGAAVLLTTDRLLAEAVRIEADRLAERLPDTDRIKTSLASRGGLFVCRNLTECVWAANLVAPARLELMTRDDETLLPEIDNAGAVFMGPWSGEAAGEYLSGANRLLPVGGAARFASGLGVDDFVKEMTVIAYGGNRLLKTGRHLALLAEADGRPAHVAAVRERIAVMNRTDQ